MNYSEKLREPQSPGKEWSEVIIKEAALAQPLFRFGPSLRRMGRDDGYGVSLQADLERGTVALGVRGGHDVDAACHIVQGYGVAACGHKRSGGGEYADGATLRGDCVAVEADVACGLDLDRTYAGLSGVDGYPGLGLLAGDAGGDVGGAFFQTFDHDEDLTVLDAHVTGLGYGLVAYLEREALYHLICDAFAYELQMEGHFLFSLDCNLGGGEDQQTALEVQCRVELVARHVPGILGVVAVIPA